jgi:hypothetical protein
MKYRVATASATPPVAVFVSVLNAEVCWLVSMLAVHLLPLEMLYSCCRCAAPDFQFGVLSLCLLILSQQLSQ